MSVAANDTISLADFQALATLANSKLSVPTPFAFSTFSDQTALPADIKPEATYTPAGFFLQKVTVRLYGYRTIAGVKTYSATPLLKAFYPVAANGRFTLKWSWTNPTGVNTPEGYILSVADGPLGGDVNSWQFRWRDIGLVSELTEDGSFSDPGWKTDTTLGLTAISPEDLPCGHGTWLKSFNTIRQATLLLTDVMCLNVGDVTGLDPIQALAGATTVTPLGIAALVSGPWCVGVSGGAGANTLSAWISKVAMYVQGATHGFSGGFTQAYKSVKFFFRSSDAPAGVNITASNTLTEYLIGSDIGPAVTAHYHLRVISCSSGHLKVNDSTGSFTVRAELDVTAGTVYDLSFDAPGIVVSGAFSVPLSLNFTFTTAAATASVADAGLELNNDVQSCAVPDSYCEVEFNNPVKNNVDSYVTIQLCSTCLQLVLTETNNTPGVWVANTLPTPGVMTFLDQDLPQYFSEQDLTSRRTPLDPTLVYTPKVPNRGALWPVFRDEDFVPDSVAGQPVQGSKAWQVMSFKSVSSLVNTDNVHPYEPGEVLWNRAMFVPSTITELRFFTSNPDFTLYVKAGGFPTVAAHDFAFAGGVWGIVAPGVNTDTTWFYSIQNNSASDASSTTTAIQVAGPAPNGTFFNTILDDTNTRVAAQENYSYHFDNPPAIALNPVPLFGYSIFAINVERTPVDNGQGVFVPNPSTADLVVEIGVMTGFGWATAGTFVPLQTVTIPAGSATRILPGFLPVLSGTFLAYRCAEVLNVSASVNFQPMMHSSFAPSTTALNGFPYTKGFFSGSAWYEFTNSHLFFVSGNPFNAVELQFSAAAFNDVENLLNLLP